MCFPAHQFDPDCADSAHLWVEGTIDMTRQFATHTSACRISILLLTAVCQHVSARSWSQKVTLSVKNMPLQKVFTLIEKQTGYAFFYDLDLLIGRTASLDVKDAERTRHEPEVEECEDAWTLAGPDLARRRSSPLG